MDHSQLAPSSAFRWVRCPGSVSLSAQYPDTGGIEADEGDAAHWLAAETFKRDPEARPVDGETAPNGVTVTDEMREGVALYVNDLRETVAAFGKDGVIQIEHKVKATSIHKDCWGTTDAALYARDAATIVIWDFKWGHGYVEVFENGQLLAYLAGILDELRGDKPDYTVILKIVQPRSYHKDGPIRAWKTTASAVLGLIQQLSVSAHEALGNNPSTHVGPHCKYCPARHACTALQNAALEAVDTAGNATPFDLTPAALGMELSLLNRASKLLEARISGLEAQAMAGIRAGSAVPGWTIGYTSGKEGWTKPAAEVIALGSLMGVNLAKPPDVITPTQAKKAGLDAALVAQFTVRNPGAARLEPIDITVSRKAFG